MKAGKTNIDLYTRVKIKGIKGAGAFLNGMLGTVTHPFAFGCTGTNWIGIELDAKSVMLHGKVNVKVSEIEIVETT